jgi:hypothetical protein
VWWKEQIKIRLSMSVRPPRAHVVGVQVPGVGTAGELAPVPVAHGERGDLRRGGQSAGTPQVQPVRRAVVQQQLDAGITRQPLRGRCRHLRAALEPGGTSGGVEVHDHLGPPALDHRPALFAAGLALDQGE